MKTQDANTQAILSRFKLNLIKRLYNELEIDDNINQALSNNRAEFLKKKSKNHTKEISFGGYFLMMMENMDVGCQFYLSTNE